jgi:hypothetical protein
MKAKVCEATGLAVQPVIQALAFTVCGELTLIVPPEAIWVSVVVGSTPFVVYRIVAPARTQEIVTVWGVVKVPPCVRVGVGTLSV